MPENLNNVEIIMKEMLEIQQKSKMFVDLLSEGEALSQNQLILLLQLKINTNIGDMKVQEIFLKFSQDKLIDMANILREVNQLMNKIF